MRVVRVTIRVAEDTPLRVDCLRSGLTGELLAFLEVGEYDVGVYGPPAALRRLAREAVVAAEQAEKFDGSEPRLAAA
jgi:hypothetical protein